MLYAVRERKGGAILTGECGSGKTLLSKVILNELSKDLYRSALVVNPRRSSFQLLREIVFQLNGNKKLPFTNKTDMLSCLEDILRANRRENYNTVVVIDEAQAIPKDDTFEELRLLLNFQSEKEFLLTLVIIGQPELKERISKIPQLRQRLSVRYHLSPLSEQETREYVKHRLITADAREDIFTEEAFSEIYRFSKGVPRDINNLCDITLLVGCGAELYQLDRDTVRAAAEDLGEVFM